MVFKLKVSMSFKLPFPNKISSYNHTTQREINMNAQPVNTNIATPPTSAAYVRRIHCARNEAETLHLSF